MLIKKSRYGQLGDSRGAGTVLKDGLLVSCVFLGRGDESEGNSLQTTDDISPLPGLFSL